jgi:hypothetical protein
MLAAEGRVLGQGGQVGQAAGVVELVQGFQGLGHGHHVGGLVVVDEADDLFPDGLVVGAVEILLVDQVRHPLPGGVFQHEAAQHRLLRLHGMGRQLEGGQFGIEDGGHGAWRFGRIPSAKRHCNSGWDALLGANPDCPIGPAACARSRRLPGECG